MAEWDDDDDFFFWRRHAKPIQVRGGIRAQAKKFGTQWWAQRWLEAVEKFGPHRRVARGRSYARKGQVLDLRIEPGLISAIVQGSRKEPYQVQIPVEKIPPAKVPALVYDLRTKPLYAAALLKGELHPEIETLFRKYGLPLFPVKQEGSDAFCNCPDSANLCKHIASIYYLISEELERDPFLILHLRGLSKEQFVSQKTSSLFVETNPEPLSADPKLFWKNPHIPKVPVQMPHSPNQRPAILQRLGSFPFWRGEDDFLRALLRIYDAVRREE